MPPQLWIDACSFITPFRTAYPIDRLPQFWEFLAQQANQGIIGSPELVLDLELTSPDSKKADDLEHWAKPLRGTMFLPADPETQAKLSEVVAWVKSEPRFKPQWSAPFLAKADPWLVAYAATHGGRIVTF